MRIKEICKVVFSEPEYIIDAFYLRAIKSFDRFFSNLSSGFALPPSRLLIALTSKCNLRCKMCCLWGKEGLAKDISSYPFFEDKLTYDVLSSVISQVAKYRTNIILTGGEPLLSPIWWDVAKLAKKKKLRLFVATGGTLLERECKKICEVVDHLQVSLDGPNEEIHNLSRGRESFDEIISGIKKIDSMKKHKKPFINICYTISDVNYFSLYDTVKFVDLLGIKIHEFAFQHLEWTDKIQLEKQSRVYLEELGIKTDFWSGFKYDTSSIDLDVLKDQIKKVYKIKTKNIESIVFRPDIKPKDIRDYYSDTSFVPDEFKRKCLSPWREAFILPSGDVWMCADWIVGNITKEKFLDIWNNERSRKLRILINKIKYFPICKTCASFYI